MIKGKIYIGTSGWSYPHWKGKFYPANVKDPNELAFYVKHFLSVEINNSFYHLPSIKTFQRWRNTAPRKFIFSVKASRYITHVKKLKVDTDGVRLFLKHARNLKEKLGPVLFQLPPQWKLNLERLEIFLSKLPKKHRYTFEFHDHTWFDDRVYQLLGKYNCAFCIYDLESFISPLKVTADFVYVRLHGPMVRYGGSYTKRALVKWAKRIRNWVADGKDVYVYLNNDARGNAALNALLLRELTSEGV